MLGTFVNFFQFLSEVLFWELFPGTFAVLLPGILAWPRNFDSFRGISLCNHINVGCGQVILLIKHRHRNTQV